MHPPGLLRRPSELRIPDRPGRSSRPEWPGGARIQTPVLGYTVPYAIGQIVLTLWGTVIVALVA